ncbi:hypothetical protein BDV38DRAFT_240687 [Aspergillus pseudotamarii]|uniref:Uncharacterized protein n=1 Tax=Aspergillus pseudotamarii TaxID=132259 RepID=A0A5N6SZ75_ASPPS|nr:uncharacterized protein BDV38DRAFT_240687 [Aspergillus pseudotamarii]KAE8139965.1 hypothetical protein BDV38DRAFT_240687 [Aspergillus pseudotamarii]
MKGRPRALIYTVGTQSAVCEHPTCAYGSIRAIDTKNIRNPATQRCVRTGRSWDRLLTGRCWLSPSELKYGSFSERQVIRYEKTQVSFFYHVC